MINMADIINKFYRKIGNNGDSSDYGLVREIGVNGIPLGVMQGASSSSDGEIGLVSKAEKGVINRYLRCDGSWSVPPNTTYSLSSFGITANATELNKLDGCTAFDS